jgi:hypothetical protein
MLMENRHEERIFIRKVEVKSSPIDVGSLGNILDRCRHNPLFVRDLNERLL